MFQFVIIVGVFDLQEGVAIEIAEAVVGALKGELAATAVNAPMVPAEVYSLSDPDYLVMLKCTTVA